MYGYVGNTYNGIPYQFFLLIPKKKVPWKHTFLWNQVEIRSRPN